MGAGITERRGFQATTRSSCRCRLGLGTQGGAKRGRGGHGTAGEPGSGVPGVLREVRSSCGRPPSCALCALPAAPPPASFEDSGEVLGGLGSRSSLSRRPQERPAPLRPRPRWRLHAPPAVAAQSPRSNHLIPFPLGGAAHLLPATPRARGAPAVLLLSAPPRPARGPGSPRSPALDNALVKTAELFLTSPPPLLIKAPPLTVQVPSIKFAEPKPLIGAAFHFSILRAGAPQTWALAHFPFVFFIREKEGDGYQERGIGKQPKGWGGGSREAGWGPFPCAPNSHTGATGRPPRSPPDVCPNPEVSEFPALVLQGAVPHPQEATVGVPPTPPLTPSSLPYPGVAGRGSPDAAC